jgi:hypothetical protein
MQIARDTVTVGVIWLVLSILSPRTAALRTQLPNGSGNESSVLTGEIFGDVSTPASFEVRAFSVSIHDGRARLEERCTTETKAGEKYTCPHLLAGRYVIAVRRVGPLEMEAGSHPAQSSSNATTFYPGTVDIDSAIPVRVDRGSVVEADLALQSVPTFTITAMLPTDATQVSLTVSEGRGDGYDIDLSSLVRPHRDSTKFSIVGLPRGTYHIRSQWLVNTSATSVAIHHAMVSASISANNIDDLRIADDSYTSVRGHILVDPDKVQLTGSLGGRILLVNVANSDEYGAAVGPAGDFTLRDVPAGTFAVRYENDGKTYVRSVTQDGRWSSGQRITIAGGHPNTLVIGVELSTEVATLKGFLRGWRGETVQGEVLVQSDESACFYTARSDVNGAFSVTGLAPGDYSVYAWHNLEQIEYANPRVLERYKGNSRSVSVGEGQTLAGVDVELLPDDR